MTVLGSAVSREKLGCGGRKMRQVEVGEVVVVEGGGNSKRIEMKLWWLMVVDVVEVVEGGCGSVLTPGKHL